MLTFNYELEIRTLMGKTVTLNFLDSHLILELTNLLLFFLEKFLKLFNSFFATDVHVIQLIHLLHQGACHWPAPVI